MVGRPSDLLGQLHWRNKSVQDVEDVEWSDITSMGLQSKYPLFINVLHSFKAAVDRHRRASSHPPLLLVELKGRAMSQDILNFIVQQAGAVDMLNVLHIWVRGAVDESLMLHFKSDRVNVRTVRMVAIGRSHGYDLKA